MLRLRDYQQAAVAAVHAARARGVRRQLVVLPTGAGKTLLAAALASQIPGRTLMLVHRDELVRQSVEKFGFVVPASDIGVVQGTRDDHDRRVVVASMQTLGRAARLRRVAIRPFALVIQDEAHHAISKTARDIYRHLGVWPETAPDRLLLGITATPLRGDKVGLDVIFEEIVYRRSILDLIRAGYLADIRGIRIRTAINLATIPVDAGGDFDAQALSLALDTPDRNALLVEAYRRYAEGLKTVVFTGTVAHARHVAEAFRAAGYAADWIAGELALSGRRRRLEAFRDGGTRILANAMILTEGWDEPSVEALLIARPTRSLGLYTQIIGRGLRPFPGKSACTVIELTGNAHDLCHVGQLTGRDLPEAEAGSGAEPLPPPERAGGALTPVSVTLAGAESLDLLARSRFCWRGEPPRLELLAGPGQTIRVWSVGTDRWLVALADRQGLRPLADQPLPLPYAQGVAEDWVREQGLERFADKDAAWRARPASERQVELLRSLGVPVFEGLTRGAASEAITQALEARKRRGMSWQ